jgi:hypothetical protein
MLSRYVVNYQCGALLLLCLCDRQGQEQTRTQIELLIPHDRIIYFLLFIVQQEVNRDKVSHLDTDTDTGLV